MAFLRMAHGRTMALDRPLVMAILNATPDSFSDGGALANDVEGRIRHAVADGADLLDVGGESTRPGHVPVPADEELRRVVPVLEACRRIAPQVPVSIDTRKATVAKAAIGHGAAIVNDVSGLADPAMAAVVAGAGAGYVAMRHQGLRTAAGAPAATPQEAVQACGRQLGDLAHRAFASGIPHGGLVLDPGLGFGEPPGGDPALNWALLRGVRDYAQGLPVLVGASRKRFVAQGEQVAARRVAQSVDAAVQAVQAGASIVRVHDVAATVDGLEGAGLR